MRCWLVGLCWRLAQWLCLRVTYMERTGMPWSDSHFLFHPIQKTKRGEVLRESGQISYSCLRDLFHKKLDHLGFSAGDFGLHSLWAGGATVATNAGVPDRLFKRHGRWKSENAKDGYVKDHVNSRLEVSRSLGLYLLLLQLSLSPYCSCMLLK